MPRSALSDHDVLPRGCLSLILAALPTQAKRRFDASPVHLVLKNTVGPRAVPGVVAMVVTAMHLVERGNWRWLLRWSAICRSLLMRLILMRTLPCFDELPIRTRKEFESAAYRAVRQN